MTKKIAIPVRYCREEASYGVNERYYITREFTDIFRQLDAILVPILEEGAVEILSEECDGLLVPGFYDDIDPHYYHEECDGANISPYFDAAALDFKAIAAFEARHKPIMGVCAGCQAINVYYGGSLYQDLAVHKLTHQHDITIEPDSLLNTIYKTTKLAVNSFHHQAIKAVGNNLRVTATASDGTIEALEKENLLAVQWHPEMMNDTLIFKEFFKLEERPHES